eukprot:3894553-Pyramimonas_sp.AAC.1
MKQNSMLVFKRCVNEAACQKQSVGSAPLRSGTALGFPESFVNASGFEAVQNNARKHFVPNCQ